MYTNVERMEFLPFSCDFGSTLTEVDMCGFKQDPTDGGDWVAHVGARSSESTAPHEVNIAEYGKSCCLAPSRKFRHL